MYIAKQRAAAFDKAIWKGPSEEVMREQRCEGPEIESHVKMGRNILHRGNNRDRF